MARKTIKELELIIANLEIQLEGYRDMIKDRNEVIDKMQLVANDSFENSTEYRRMNKEIEYLKTVIKGHEITIKAKDETIKKNRDAIQKLLKENEELKNKNNSVQKIKQENEQLKQELKYAIADKERTLRICVEEVEAVENKYKQQCSDVSKIKNERNAGRKERFTEEEKATLKMLRFQGKSYRAIAKELNCSVATVHKIINEQK